MDTPPINPIIGLLPAFLRALAVVAKGPALGPKVEAVSSTLAFTATAIERGFEARAEFEELAALVQSLAEADKPSNLQTWFDFKARSDAAQAVFDAQPPGSSVEK